MKFWAWMQGFAGGILAALLWSDRLNFLEFVGASVIAVTALVIVESAWNEFFTA